MSGSAELVERDRELRSLAGAVDALAAGNGGLALIEGPAGIGKTRLLAAARELAGESGVRALAARASELEREFPFGVVRQLFEPALAGVDREALFAGAAAPALPVFESTPGEGSEAASFAVLHGLYWLTLELAAEQPLLLAIDDLQWCDRPSLRYVAYLVRRLEGQPVLAAATLRSAEPGTDPVLLGELTHDPLTRRIQPPPLSEEATLRLAGERLGGAADPAFAAACHRATGGNPLLVRELLGALAAEGVAPTAANARAVTEMDPSTVSRSVLLRLSKLPATAIAVAHAIAVLSEGASVAEIATLTGLDEAAVAAATGALARAEILRPEPPLGFVHPLVLDAVYRELSPGERELAHGRAAVMLRQRSAGAEEVATHLMMTPPGGDPEVAKLLRNAGRSAARKGATDSAVTYLRRALEEPPAPAARPVLLRELGLAESLTEGPAGARRLREAYAATEDPLAKAVIAHMLTRIIVFTESPREAAELARRVRGELPEELVDARQALEAFELSVIVFGEIDPAEGVRLEPYRQIPPDAGLGLKLLASIAATVWSQLDAGAEECSELALAALAGGDLLHADAGYLGIGPITVLTIADREEAVTAIEDALAVAHSHGSLFAASGVHMWRGFTYLWRGELEDAEETLELARSEFNEWSFGAGAGHYLNGFLAPTQLERGDLAGARASLDRAERPAEGDNSDGARYWGNANLLVMQAEAGAPEEIVAAADAFAAQHARVLNPVTSCWRPVKAAALARLERQAEALDLAEEQLELARRWGSPGSVGNALRMLGTLKGGDGLPELEEAIAVLEGTPARLEHAKALGALGTALRLARRPSEAREPLQRALEGATVCSATRLAARVREELHASGARPRREALSGIEALTPSERRVTRLAAAGLTNREVAQQLFVTPKTVEVHLSNAYRKLDIRSRRELAGALANT